MSSRQIEDDEVFTDEVAKAEESSQFKSVSTIKDHSNAAHLQRILSVPEQSSQPTDSSKITSRSISVSPSGRNVKCSSVIISSRSKSPSSGISSGERPSSGDAPSPDQYPDCSQQESTSKPTPKPRLVKQSTKGDPSSNESDALHDDETDSSSPQTSKPIPIPRSLRSRTESEQKSDTPESPVPKPRSVSKVTATQSDEKAKAVKTLQTLLPVGAKQKKAEAVGPDGLTRTERSLRQMQQLMNEE